MTFRPLLVALFCLSSTLAAAQTAQVDRPRPGIAIQLRFDPGVPIEQPDAFTLLRTELYGQYHHGGSGFGAYASIPILSAIPKKAASTTTIGNVEVGGFKTFSFGVASLTLRFGVALPTYRPSTVEQLFTTIGGGFGRLTDVVQVAPYTTAVRLAVSPRIQIPYFFAQIDVGFDVTITESATISLGSRKLDLKGSVGGYFRANLALGARVSIVSLALELVNIANIRSDLDATIAERFLHSLGGTLAVHAPYVHPFFGVYTPLDEGLRGNVIFLSAGIEGVL